MRNPAAIFLPHKSTETVTCCLQLKLSWVQGATQPRAPGIPHFKPLSGGALHSALVLGKGNHIAPGHGTQPGLLLTEHNGKPCTIAVYR